MGKIRFYKQNTIIFFILIVFLTISATYDEILSDKKKQIERYNYLISETEGEIASLNSIINYNEKKLDSLNSSLLVLDEFLKDYTGTDYLTPEEIAAEANMVIFLSDEVIKLQESFKKKIINLYKHGRNYELELLLSSKTPNEYLRRNEYLQKFAQTRKRELKELESKKYLLNEKKKLLQLSVSSQRYYVETKRTEKKYVLSEISNLTAEKNKLFFKHDVLEEKLRLQKKLLNAAEVFLDNFQNNKNNFKGSKLPRINYNSDDLTHFKGNLNQPVDINLVKNKFGDCVNSLSGTITFNSGIDYSIAMDSKVYSVADGIVSLTGEIPYYGKVVIIAHPNGYRTVYACLNDINVKTGDKIRLNQLIGKTGENYDGQTFHFELWKDNIPLNPEEWLRF